MAKTNIELYNAVNLIREHCIDSNDCPSCPLSIQKGTNCPFKSTMYGTTTLPNGWGLQSPNNNKNYKVFQDK